MRIVTRMHLGSRVSVSVAALVLGSALDTTEARAGNFLQDATKGVACTRERAEFESALLQGDLQRANMLIAGGLRLDCGSDVVTDAEARLTAAERARVTAAQSRAATDQQRADLLQSAWANEQRERCMAGLRRVDEFIAAGDLDHALYGVHQGDTGGCDRDALNAVRVRLQALVSSVVLEKPAAEAFHIACPSGARLASTMNVSRYMDKDAAWLREGGDGKIPAGSEVWCEKPATESAGPVPHGPWLRTGESTDVERRHFVEGKEHGFRLQRVERPRIAPTRVARVPGLRSEPFEAEVAAGAPFVPQAVFVDGVAAELGLPSSLAAACGENGTRDAMLAALRSLRAQLGVGDRVARDMVGWVPFSIGIVRSLDRAEGTTGCIFDLGGALGLTLHETDTLVLHHLRSLDDAAAWSDLQKVPESFRTAHANEFQELGWRVDAVQKNGPAIEAIVVAQCAYMNAANVALSREQECNETSPCPYDEQAKRAARRTSTYDAGQKEITKHTELLDASLDREIKLGEFRGFRRSAANKAVAAAIEERRGSRCGDAVRDFSTACAQRKQLGCPDLGFR